MKNLFKTILKALQLTKKGRPLSAALVLQDMVPAPTAKPKRKLVKTTVRRKKSVVRHPQKPLPGSFVSGTFKSPHAVLSYKLYTPTGSARRRMPLIVMLHGCTQSAADFAAGTGMNALADEIGFLVLYPEQSQAANLARCWNWHRPENQVRGKGEPAAIAALTRYAIALCRANPARIYIAGISAGGVAAAIIAAAYPDLYVAAGVHSGLAHGNVSTLGAALSAMRGGNGHSATGKTTRPPPTIVFHGDKDTVVHPSNASGFLNILQRSRPGPLVCRSHRGQSQGGRAFTRKLYSSGPGEVLLEDWTVHGSGHSWSGGTTAGSHTDPAGPDASREMVRFFLARKRAVKGQITAPRPSRAYAIRRSRCDWMRASHVTVSDCAGPWLPKIW